MGFDAGNVETVLIDSYSTLVDEVSTREALETYTDAPEAVARIWYERSSIYGIAGTLLGEFETTKKRNEVALDYALHTAGVDIPESERDSILETVDYDVFDDVRGGIERLTDGGYEVYVLSNGDPDMLADLVEYADIEDLVSGTISAAEVGVYKPDPRLYRYAAQRVDTPVTGIAHVTASWYDIQGAISTGMQGVWIRRSGKEWENLLKDPDLRVGSFHAFADELGL